MSKHPIQSWLAIQERRKSYLMFSVEWLSLFLITWLFWSLMFWAAPGSFPPKAAAIAVSALYATSLIYGRMLHATGCSRCSNPLPFLRKEVGRRRLPDQEDCMEVQYGAEEYGQQVVQDYYRIIRADMVTYRCRHCGQNWEERVQLPGSEYLPVRRSRAKDRKF